MTFVRTVFIGDVHGCTAELLTMLGALRLKPVQDRVVFLGDIIDKGENSKEALLFVRQTVAQLPGSFCLMGNHEKKWLRKLDRGDPNVHGFDGQDIAFMRSLPLFMGLPDIGWFAVHGGVYPKLLEALGDLRDEDAVHPHPTDKKRGKMAEKMAHTRTIDSDGDFVPLNKPERTVAHWSDVYDGRFGIAAFGHDPKKEPIVAPSALGLDTGCCYGWSLSAAIVRGTGPDEKPEIVSVPALKQYAEHRGDTE